MGSFSNICAFHSASLPKEHEQDFLHVLGNAGASNPLNKTIASLENNEKTILRIRDVLRNMGQDKFINLSRSYKQSAAVLAMYAGNGIVTKIIPKADLSHTRDVIYHMPAITSVEVSGEKCDYVIKTYPWVSGHGIGQGDVEEFRAIIKSVGLEFNGGDDRPKNVHRLPDKKGTFVGVDSNMYHETEGGMNISPELRQLWHSYIHHLFPIYALKSVPAQTKETNFKFISIHDPSFEAISFEDFAGRTDDIEPPFIPLPEA